MKLHDLHPTPGSRRPPRRVGRGHGSGRGKTAGRGTKGQKARGKTAAWFEGGQTPLHIRTPKLHGFKNRFRVAYAPVNLARLAGAAEGTLITPAVLEHDGLVRDLKLPIKVLGQGDAPKGVTVHAHAFSRAALDKLAAAGSTAQRLSWPDNAPVDDDDDAEADEPAADAAVQTEAQGADAESVTAATEQATDEPDQSPDQGSEPEADEAGS
jgi:large subunit ribosomal protein L15